MNEALNATGLSLYNCNPYMKSLELLFVIV